MRELHQPIETWAAWRKAEEKRAQSSSGGLAAVLAEEWVRQGGVVYGAAFVPPFEFRHVRCTTLEEVERLKGSKYVQSSLQGVFGLMETDLRQGRKVLFVGTPCQVAGVRQRMRAYGTLLYTVDIVCHGTPPVHLLKESIPQEALRLDFDEVSFRKNNQYGLAFRKQGREVWSRPLTADWYMKGFFKALFCRECCYRCPYAGIRRTGDLTLGDFWGVDRQVAEGEAEKGISLVLVNSAKGKALLDGVEDAIVKTKRPLEEAVAGNRQLRAPMPRTWRNSVFRSLYPRMGFRWAAILSMPDIVLKNKLR